MKKLIALAIVAVMLVAMAVNVLAAETVYATAVASDSVNLADGTISAGEYGDYVAYFTSDLAYDDNSEDELFDANGKACNSYLMYQNADPFFMDCYLYIAWAYDTAERFYFGFDMANIDGKFVGLSLDGWNDEAVQWRMSTNAATEDPTIDNGSLWANDEDETYNIIATALTGDLEGGYAVDGKVFVGDELYIRDHNRDGVNCTEEGWSFGSIGVKADRFHFEVVLLNSFWKADPAMKAGDEFAYSVAIFNTSEGNDSWESMLTWGHGISGYNNGLGKTGTNKVILAEKASAPVTPPATEPTVTEPTVTEPTVTEPTVTEPTVTEPTVTEPTTPGTDTGDALVVVVATAIMALGTAVIVKKVR